MTKEETVDVSSAARAKKVKSTQTKKHLNEIKKLSLRSNKKQESASEAAIKTSTSPFEKREVRIVEGEEKISLTNVVKNLGFVLKNVPFAAKKAEDHFNKAIEVAKEIGAKGIEGRAYLDLGHLHKVKGRSDHARDCFSKAVRIFEECEADVYLKQAKEALKSLG